MRLHPILFLVFSIVGCALAQEVKPVADRVAAQNAVFDEQYESDLRNFPERATAFGDYRYNDRLAEYSLDAIQRRHETDQAFLSRLETERIVREEPCCPDGIEVLRRYLATEATTT